jgi:hypothetical protein
MFISPEVPIPQQPDGFLYRVILRWIEPAGNTFPLIYPIIAFTLLYTQAIMLNKIVVNQRLLQKTTYLAGMAYLLITSLFTEWNHLSAPIIINSLLIWVLSELCKLHNNPNPKSLLFNIGIMIGLATFFYFPSIAFSLLVVVGLIITRPFRVPEWVMVVLGILTPYYFLISWAYLTDRMKEFDVPEIAITIPVLYKSAWAYGAIILIFLTQVVGTFFIQHNMRRQLVQTRKSWGLVFLYLLVSLLVPFLNETDDFEYWILIAVPLSVIASAAFLYPDRKWFAYFVHWGMVALIIIMQYFIN